MYLDIRLVVFLGCRTLLVCLEEQIRGDNDSIFIRSLEGMEKTETDRLHIHRERGREEEREGVRERKRDESSLYYATNYTLKSVFHSLISCSLVKRKIPFPCADPIGFMIHTPPTFLNSSTNMEYSLGNKKVVGMKSYAAASSCFPSSSRAIIY